MQNQYQASALLARLGASRYGRFAVARALMGIRACVLGICTICFVVLCLQVSRAYITTRSRVVTGPLSQQVILQGIKWLNLVCMQAVMGPRWAVQEQADTAHHSHDSGKRKLGSWRAGSSSETGQQLLAWLEDQGTLVSHASW